MKILVKVLCLSFLLCFLLTHKDYSYNESSFYHFSSASSSGYSEVQDNMILNQMLTLNDLNVKFTQDDSNYIFKVTGTSEFDATSLAGSYPNESLNDIPAPLMYKTENFGDGLRISENGIMPYSDFRHGDVYQRDEIIVGGTRIHYSYNAFTQISPSKVENSQYQVDTLEDRVFIGRTLRDTGSSSTYNYLNALNYPVSYSVSGVSLVSNGSSVSFNNSTKKFNYRFDVKVKVNKSYIDKYRYLCFGNSDIITRTVDLTSAVYRAVGLSVCTPTIDLKEYAKCHHNWSVTIKDSDTHVWYCDDCEWEKEENHNLIYEYDGIKDNVCTCSYIKKVNYNFVINDDATKEVQEICDVGDVVPKHEFIHKTGYKFNWYDKYEKNYMTTTNLFTKSNLLIETLIATCSEFDEEAGNKSIVYKANCTPIKYIIKYSNDNNKNLVLDGHLDDECIDYDEKINLKDNIYFKGYIFAGWTLDKDSERVDFENNAEILNYTTEDLKEYTIYPIYHDLNFDVTYGTDKGSFDDGSVTKVVKYNYFDNKKMEKPHSGESELYFDHYVDSKGNIFKTMGDIRVFVEKEKKENYKLSLMAVFSGPQYGKPERTSDSSMAPGRKNEVANQGGPSSFGPGVHIEESVAPLDNGSAENNLIVLQNKYINLIHGMTTTSIKKKATKSTLDYISTDSEIRKSTWSVIIEYGEDYYKYNLVSVNSVESRLMELVKYVMNNAIWFILGAAVFIGMFTTYGIFVVKSFDKSVIHEQNL